MKTARVILCAAPAACPLTWRTYLRSLVALVVVDSRSVQGVPTATASTTVSSYPSTEAFLWLAVGPEGSAEGISFFDDLANRYCLYFLYGILLFWRYIPGLV